MLLLVPDCIMWFRMLRIQAWMKRLSVGCLCEVPLLLVTCSDVQGQISPDANDAELRMIHLWYIWGILPTLDGGIRSPELNGTQVASTFPCRRPCRCQCSREHFLAIYCIATRWRAVDVQCAFECSFLQQSYVVIRCKWICWSSQWHLARDLFIRVGYLLLNRRCLLSGKPYFEYASNRCLFV